MAISGRQRGCCKPSVGQKLKLDARPSWRVWRQGHGQGDCVPYSGAEAGGAFAQRTFTYLRSHQVPAGKTTSREPLRTATGVTTGTGGATGANGLVGAWAEWPMPNGPADVTAGAPNPESYTDNGDGTVTDNVTGLMWQQAEPAIGNIETWDNAVAHCQSLTLAGHSDWRLPSRIELVSIVDLGQSEPSYGSNSTAKAMPGRSSSKPIRMGTGSRFAETTTDA